jgi:type VI protein secretion system component VasK
MTFLDIFALFILLVLATAAVAVWVILGMLPGRIARKRKHPQADAIAVCGLWGAITLGLLMPIAFIWAYTDARWREQDSNDTDQTASPDKEACA